ncbi:MAG: Mur ligase family protein [Microscillaceae bacterium]|nr:Mur ligase family protein [Microscillaceae bacterium]
MTQSRRIHFIAIGGVIMHNLAIDAHLKGYTVSGSDDEIYEPSRSNLDRYGILPAHVGWNPDMISPDIDSIVLGMHAKMDNPELLKAQSLRIPIYSYPEYIYRQSMHKQRIVITGSHGKSTITAMIMHVLQCCKRKFDYLIGAPIEGFSQNIRLSQDAPTMVIEGDEYFSSPLDNTPKCLHYQHHIGLISGISWDHMNVYPTFEAYQQPFQRFADATPKAGVLVYSQDDALVSAIGSQNREDVTQIPYQIHPNKVIEGITYLIFKDQKIPLKVFGDHNLKNISGAKQICMKVGVTEDDFYQAISSFKGAAKRLEKVVEAPGFDFFIDFAHSPSKLQATTTAVKKQFTNRTLVASIELHTFSSLNKGFLPQYRDSFEAADEALVYYNPEVVLHKKLDNFDPQEINKAFNHKNLTVFTSIEALKIYLLQQSWKNKTLLMMSSGTYDHLNFHKLGEEIIQKLS